MKRKLQKMKRRPGSRVSPKVVSANLPLIRLLAKVKSPKGRHEILNAGERLRLGESICSMCKNVAMKPIKGLTPKQRRAINTLGGRRLSRKRRNAIIAQQKGGFLPMLLSMAAPLLSTIFR